MSNFIRFVFLLFFVLFSYATVAMDAPPAPIERPLGDGGRYIDHEDGTVTDMQSGLTWMRCSVGQNWDGTTCQGEVTKMDWDKASTLKISLAGHNDWRIPVAEELINLVNNQYRPTVDPVVFPNTPGIWFWSVLPYISRSNHAWIVDFRYGSNHYSPLHHENAVRLVRGTPKQR